MKISNWTLSPCYMIALGLTVNAVADPMEAGGNLILASFDTELKAKKSPLRAFKAKPVISTKTDPAKTKVSQDAFSPEITEPDVEKTGAIIPDTAEKILKKPDSKTVEQRFKAASAQSGGAFEAAMTELEPLAADHPALIADMARLWMKRGQHERASAFLEKNQPLDATSTVLYAWTLLRSRQDEKLGNLLHDIEKSSLRINNTRLQSQLTDIRRLHAVHVIDAPAKTIALPASANTPTATRSPWDILKSANQLRQSGDKAKADQNIDELLRSDTSNDARHAAALYYAGEKLWDAAILTLEKIPTTDRGMKINDLHREIRAQLKLRAAIRLGETHADVIKPLTEAEQLATGLTSMTGDIVSAWMKFGHHDRAVGYLEKNMPSDNSLLALHGWALLNARQDEKLSRLIAQIDSGTYGKLSPEVQQQFADIRKYHAGHLAENTTVTPSAAVTAPSLANRRSNRQKFDPYSPLGLSNWDASFSQRSKTGEQGTSRLLSRKEPTIGYGWQSEDTDYRINIDRVTLNSGTADFANVIVGTDGLVRLPNGLFPAVPAAKKMSMTGYEPSMTARHDTAMASYTGEIGLTPSEGALPSTLTGRFNAVRYAPWGNAGVDLYLQPVRDSLLSYTGLADPFGALSPWGRVIKTGLSPSANWNITPKWSLAATLQLEELTGVNTRKNNHYSTRIGVGYSFEVNKFEYLNIDFSGSYDHYQNNQNLSSYGNGGYYSPQSAINFGPSVNFLTRNFYPLVLQGRFAIGTGHASNAEAMKLPLDPANAANAPGAAFYSGNSKGVNYGFSLQALWNMQKDLQLGCSLAYSQSNASVPNFKENNLNFFVRMPIDGIVK